MPKDEGLLEDSRWANHRLPAVGTSELREIWHPLCGKTVHSHRNSGPPNRPRPQKVMSRDSVWTVTRDVFSSGENPRVNFSSLTLSKVTTMVEGVDQPLSWTSDQFPNLGCQVIYSQFGLTIHQNDHQARRRFVEWVQNEIAVVPDFHKRILFSDEAHFWLNGYVKKQNCRIWSEANSQVYVETPLHPEKLTVWCALWAGGILLQKR
ncbi:hypothetical protein TNCV_4577081 [Trichonephila clavipes]|nr:hypothetical protein TNCV_4577081 [Trichonephila clavipes]